VPERRVARLGSQQASTYLSTGFIELAMPLDRLMGESSSTINFQNDEEYQRRYVWKILRLPVIGCQSGI
jgi:hypothetical protein